MIVTPTSDLVLDVLDAADPVTQRAATAKLDALKSSGADFAAMSVPMLPPAPGRLSTTTAYPSCSVSFWLTSRATILEPPPGGKGSMSRIGLSGYGCASGCAHALL